MRVRRGVLLAAAGALIALPATGQLRVTTTGNVGIAQNNPSQKLDINGSALLEGTGRVFGNSTNKYVGMANGIDMGLISKDGTWLRIGSAGGIGLFGSTSGESGSATTAFVNYYGLGISGNSTGSAAAWSGVNLYVAGSGWLTGVLSVGSDKRQKKVLGLSTARWGKC